MLKRIVYLLSAFSVLAAQAFAQSPNTSTIIVFVVDQSAAVVKDASVSVTNNQTGAVRESTSGVDGAATFPALSLTGTYTIRVTKPGFVADDVTGLALRAGETASVRVKLVASGASQTTMSGLRNTIFRSAHAIALWKIASCDAPDAANRMLP